ncbi:MAG TPA: hypothetical protein VIL26_01150 [Clostridia bacterium]
MKKSLIIIFSAIILILGMLMILSSYEKVHMAGVFGKDLDEDYPLCEIIEDEKELITLAYDENEKPKIDNESKCPECKPRCPKCKHICPDECRDEHQKCPDKCKDKEKCPDKCKEPEYRILPYEPEIKDGKKQSQELEHKKKHHPRKRHRFFDFKKINIHNLTVETLDSQEIFNSPIRYIRPDLKRKSTGRRKSLSKTLPLEDSIQQVDVLLDDDVYTYNYQAQKSKILQTVFGNVISKDSINKLVVKGEPISGQYFDNIVIEIYGMDNVLINTIRPKTNSGYGANIMLGDFIGNGMEQIFLGINSGGSGGFGYFYVFDVSNNEIKTIFDYEDFSQKNKYVGKYLDYYRAEVRKIGSDERYIIDLSGRPRDYLDMIWGPDGKLIGPKSVNISDVNTVFPYYNSTSQLFELMIFQRVTGLYNADGLGYVTTQQSYKDGGFVTFFETLGVFAQ